MTEKLKSDILIVDDEPQIRELIKDILEDEGYVVRLAGDGVSARAAVNERKPDLMLLDIWMPDEDGISLLKEFKASGKENYPVIMMSGHGTIETAIEATRLGAYGFIEKPLTMNKLLQSVRDALAKGDAGASPSSGARPVVGDSMAARALRRLARELSLTNEPILICGDAGVGKRAFAAWVHSMSSRMNEPFFELRDDIWFEEDGGRAGRDFTAILSDVSTGTLFAPCVDLMTPAMRRAMAELAENGTLGGQRYDLRVMVSCHSQNDAAELSPDHIAGMRTVNIPELKERPEDISDLLRASVDYHSQNSGLPYRRFSIAAQNYLRHREWCDNLRELDGLVRELLQHNDGAEISLREVEEALHARSPVASDWFRSILKHPLREARELFEKAYLQQLLSEVDGNMSKLAERTGMERTHLYRKLRMLDIKAGRRST